MAAAAPTQLKPSEIEVVKDFNPRTTMDKQKLDELAQSIKQHGLIQPLVVGEKTDKGKYPLVAGHRRLAALKKNKATTVDVKVLSVNGNAKALAVTENLQREAVNPIDEANGFAQVMETEGLNQKTLASRLGISTSQVSDRLKLLKLPESAQAAIAAGDLPASVAGFIEKIAQVSTEFADVMAQQLAKQKTDASVILGDRYSTTQLFDEACVAAGKKGIFAIRVDDGRLGILLQKLSGDTPEEKETLKVLYAARNDWEVPRDARPTWTTEDDTAARSYKVLIEHKNSQSSTIRVVVDGQFMMDRLTIKREKYEKARTLMAAKKSSGGPSEDKVKEQRAAEREQKRKAKLAAQAFNDDLGAKLRTAYGTAEVTLENMKVLVLMILNRDEYNSTPAGMMAFTTPEYHDQHVKTLKDGREQLKVDLLPATSVDENVKRLVLAAGTIEEVMGIFYRFVLSALLVDRESVSPPDRRMHGWTIPGTRLSDDVDFSPRAHLLRAALAVVDEDRQLEMLKELELLDAGDDEALAEVQEAHSEGESIGDIDIDGDPLVEDPAAETDPGQQTIDEAAAEGADA